VRLETVARLAFGGVTTLVELIAKKRDGHAHAAGEIERIIASLVSGELADYQMSAWLMAVFFRGMTDTETVALTQAMLHSGDVLDLSSVPGIKVDKHSTGGVGDKVSLALAPLVASCGVPVPMVSGRGLGHTGGTLDKLEAIPGFSVNLDTDAFVRIVRDVGTAMIGQTARIAPADKRIYALRDVTATVESIPLIVASILSKKLAEGIDGLVLDVKVGRGAFMKTEAAARELATALVRVGTAAGKKTTALLTTMDDPLGCAIGNSNETREAILLLHGAGPSDLTECTMALGAEMLRIGGVASSDDEARAKLADAIASGRAARTMERLVEAQGGDPRVVADPSLLPTAPILVEVRADRSGYVGAIDSLELGLTAVALGAGRTRVDQKVDPGVGIDLRKKPGEAVAAGETLATIRLREGAEAPADRVRAAFRVDDARPAARPLILGRIEAP
jgi:pyrimidine-nucleoside phosphorylase